MPGIPRESMVPVRHRAYTCRYAAHVGQERRGILSVLDEFPYGVGDPVLSLGSTPWALFSSPW